MAVLAQQGWGRSDKIESGIRAGHLAGVVISPKDESPANLNSFVRALRDEFGGDVEILFDPQFYVSTIVDAREGHLPDYPYYRSGLTRASFISPGDVRSYAADVIAYQATMDFDRIISAGVRVEDLNSPWSQIALSMAAESINAHANLNNPAPLLLSLVMDEGALTNREALDELLNIISVWDVKGFYILVRASSERYPPRYEEASLEGVLYLSYALSDVNDYEVVFGYSDLVGIILHATGARHIATGWYNTLRQFSLSRFEPSSGGQPRRRRYTSAPLLSSVLLVPELDTMYHMGLLPSALTGTPYDQGIIASGPANADWPIVTECLHHWSSLEQLVTHVLTQPSTADRLTEIVGLINAAVANYAQLTSSGVVFDAATGPGHLSIWERAIRDFRADNGV